MDIKFYEVNGVDRRFCFFSPVGKLICHEWFYLQLLHMNEMENTCVNTHNISCPSELGDELRMINQFTG